MASIFGAYISYTDKEFGRELIESWRSSEFGAHSGAD